MFLLHIFFIIYFASMFLNSYWPVGCGSCWF